MLQQKHLYFASLQISNPSSFPSSSLWAPQLQRHRQQLRCSSLPPWRSEASKSLCGTWTQIDIKVLWQTSQALTIKNLSQIMLSASSWYEAFYEIVSSGVRPATLLLHSFSQHKYGQSSALFTALFICTIKRLPNVCQYDKADALIMTTKKSASGQLYVAHFVMWQP